jgi:hypothetical protein
VDTPKKAYTKTRNEFLRYSSVARLFDFPKAISASIACTPNSALSSEPDAVL